MRIAHIADPHLGFRQFHRLTARGLNQREADVAAAFGRTIDGVIAARPDAVIVAGDLFHAVRPTNSAILYAFRQFARLIDALPGVPVVLIAGNHDTPRSTDTVSIFGLFRELGMHVAHDVPQRFEFGDLGVLAVPHQALFAEQRPALEPAGSARQQVLVLHGETPGLFGVDRSMAEAGGAFLTAQDLAGGDWSYVALGHYHVQHEVRERVWYAGALDYVSPNPWGELREERQRGIRGKGWLLVDLEAGTVERQAIEAPRRIVDLPWIDAADLAAGELDRLLAEAVDGVPGGLDDAVVRQVVRNAPRTMSRDLDHAAIRAWKARALHFQLDLRRPEPVERVDGSGGARAPPDTERDGGDIPCAPPAPGGRGPRGVRHDGRRGDCGARARGTATLMQLLRLRLVNFRQHEATDLEFGPGLTGIIGPNGSGKTTVLEAIAYALYGVPAARGTRETMRRRGAPARSRFEVDLEFMLGVHRYRLVRSLTMAELFQDGQTIANSTAAVTERITSLLGMSREEFFNTYFTGQKQLAVMASMTPSERAQFLSRVLGYERLREAQERVRAVRSSLRSELAGIEQGLADPAEIEANLTAAVGALDAARAEREQAEAREHSAAERLAALGPQWTAAEQRRTAWQGLDGERRIVEGKVARARGAFQAIDRELATAARAQARLTELGEVLGTWDALATERDQLDRSAAAYTLHSRAVARRDQARRRIEELQPQISALADDAGVGALAAARAEVAVVHEEVERKSSERRTRWTQDEQDVRTKLSAFRDRYRELEQQQALITERGPEGICPTCGRPLGKDFQALLDLLGRQLEEVRIDGTYLRQRADQLRELPGDLRELDVERERLDAELRRRAEALGQAQAQLRQRRELESELGRLVAEASSLDTELAGPAATYDAARHEAVRTALAQLEPMRRERDQAAGLAARAQALAADAEAAEAKATAVEAELAALDARLVALAWDADAFAATERDVRAAEAALADARISLARSAANVEGAERLRSAALARRADRAAKAELSRRLSDRIDLHHELDRAFGDLRAELTLRMRPELQDHASALLSHLTAGRYPDLELDEQYVPQVVEDGEVKPVISGGEEDIVNLALRLAISQMIAERAGQPLSLLILDEVFGSLDEERRAGVLDLLRGLADRFPQVILITHVDGMRDVFDRVIRMSYDVARGVTTAVEETDAGDVAA